MCNIADIYICSEVYDSMRNCSLQSIYMALLGLVTSDIIYGIYVSIFPCICMSISLCMWHLMAIFVTDRYIAIGWETNVTVVVFDRHTVTRVLHVDHRNTVGHVLCVRHTDSEAYGNHEKCMHTSSPVPLFIVVSSYLSHTCK